VPKSEVYGVATHYPEFRLAPPGRRIVRVCTGVSCRVSGSPDLVSRLERDLEISAGETRADGGATLEEMDCAFLCSMAPVVEVDRRCRGRVTAGELGALLDESAPVPTAARPVEPAPPMEGRGPVARWDALARAAGSRERLRLSVGSGSCGRAVGARAIFEGLRHEVARQGLAVEVIEGGCHGMCFAAPSVDLISADGARLTFPRLAIEALPALVAAINAGRQDSIPAIPWSPGEPFLAGQRRLLTDRWGLVDPMSLADAIRHGSYHTLARVLEEGGPDRVIAEVRGSGLQGRGGAYFPAAVKWDACRKAAGEPKYLVVNGEEGEPGIFKDRHLMEADPHRLLEGMLLAAYAGGATRAILYIHGEADLSAERLARAVAEAEAWGLLGDRILGAEFSCHVELRRGAGGFILGEETALLESIEGRRAMPRTRPPFPVESGLWGKPTVINNVETLAAVPLIVERGGAWFSGLGRGTGPSSSASRATWPARVSSRWNWGER
jgi:NADH:ubiquinone oxidoreductase subunit E